MTNSAELSLKNEVNQLSDQWKNILKNSNLTIQNETPQKILFVTGMGLGTSFLTIEPTIMMSLKALGHDIHTINCNLSVPACEFNFVGNNRPDAGYLKQGVLEKSVLFTCNKCSSNVRDFHEILPVTHHTNDLFLTLEDYKLAKQISQSVKFEEFREFKYNDIAVGEEAFASLIRATFTGVVTDTKENRFLVPRYIMSGVLTAIALERAMKKINPDRVCMIHGIYQTHGLASKVATSLGIPAIVMGGGGIRKDTVIMCHGETYHHQLINESNDRWENYVLSDLETQKVMEYATSKRYNGASVDYFNFHPNPIEDKKEILNQLGIKNENPIISLFTNVIWDAQLYYNGNAFDNIFDWVKSSIDEASKNPNINLVVRIHPAEVKSPNPTHQPIKAEILKIYPTLPTNVYIVDPESDISSYKLAEISRAAIIYGTKMGLELALLKIPLIICGETFSRNKNYGLDIKSKNQYSDLFSKIQDFTVDVEKKYKIALKYAHYFYFRRMIDLPIDSNKVKILKFKSINELTQIPQLQTITAGILSLKEFEHRENRG